MSDVPSKILDLYELSDIYRLATHIGDAPHSWATLRVDVINHAGDRVIEIQRDVDGNVTVNFDVE